MTDQIRIDLTSASGCGCHDSGRHDDPVLDARLIPHQVRHPAIFGALDSLAAESSLVLVAPHDPLPLLAQATARYHDGITVEYLMRGPDEWRLRLTR